MRDPFQPRDDELAKRTRKWFRENPCPKTAVEVDRVEVNGETIWLPRERPVDAGRLIRRLFLNVDKLDRLIERGGGLRFGTMPPQEAFEYLQDTERRIAEVRAALDGGSA